MKRERYIEDYEDFEPEMRIWPFAILSFLLPLIPFCAKVILSENLSFFTVLTYLVSVLPLLFASITIKDGEKAWLLLLSSALYMLLILLEWVNVKLQNGEQSSPFYILLSPSILPIIAYAFFNKRRRMPWLGWMLIGFFFSSLVGLVSYISRGELSFEMVYPGLIVLLSLSIIAVTRRTDSTPWFISILLFLTVIASFLSYQSFSLSFESLTFGTIVESSLRSFLYSNSFWYNISFLFVFSALAGKSSYKKALIEEDEEERISVKETPSQSCPEKDDRYTSAPPFSRFEKKEEREERNEKREKEEYEARQYSYSNINSQKQDDYGQKNNDKWYEFIKNGVEDRKEDRGRRENRSRDYYDSYDRENDRRMRDERYYNRSRYDERRDDDYYPDRRRERDDDYYYPPRDKREGRDSDYDRYIDRDDYRERERYRDSSYRDYPDDDRRR